MADGIITKSDVQTSVELRLRQSHIPVRTVAETLKSFNIGELQLQIVAVKSPNTANLVYAYRIEIGVIQTVYILRDGKQHAKSIIATTWSNGNIHLVGSAPVNTMNHDILQTVNDDILQEVDAFCNDYLASHETTTALSVNARRSRQKRHSLCVSARLVAVRRHS